MTAPIPEIYLIWHPGCAVGEPLARRIFEWLRTGAGLGPDIFFRSLPAPDAARGNLPLPLPGEPVTGAEPARADRLQVLLPLIDANMVADLAWRSWVPGLAGPPRVVFPVALDRTAYNLAPAMGALNYIRPTLPIPTPIDDVAVKRFAHPILKQITEALTRLILPRRQLPANPSHDPPAKISVFISHAKKDGTGPASRLRDYILGQTQLAAFYDENEIPFGADFARRIEDSLDGPNTAALIAVRTSEYPYRPWCRREIVIFRRPRQEASQPHEPERWRLYPTLVVEAMQGSEVSPGVAEFGRSTVIRWNSDDPAIEETIVTTITRNAMLAAFHATLAEAVPAPPGAVVINWLPEPATLLHIPSLRAPGEQRLYYPGHGLSGLELESLSEIFPNLDFIPFGDVIS